MRSPNDAIIVSVFVTGSVVTGSSAIPLTHLGGYSIQAIMSGSGPAGVTGSFKLQASLDRTPSVNAAVINLTNWTDISGSSASIAVNPNTNHSVIWNVADAYYPHVRLLYTNTAGSGSLNARFAGKGI